MISNTSSSELKLVDKIGLLPGYQQKLQYSTSTSGNNNNNNNDISNNKNMSSAPTTLQLPSTQPFTFYTSGGIGAGGGTPSTECTTIIIQRCSSEEIVNNSSLPVDMQPTDQSNECIHYEPCSYYNSKQENELTKKIFNNFRNDSALNGVVAGGGYATLANVTEKTTGDTSISYSSSNSSNSSNRSSKSDRQKSPMCRTEDQENAFRQIEDVHNYSKLNRYSYCNGRGSGTANVAMYSSNSSNPDDDEDDDDEEDDGEEEEENEDDDVDYEHHLHAKVGKLSSITQQSEKAATTSLATATSTGREEPQQKMIESENTGKEQVAIKMDGEVNPIPPDHHARRPMNAFLIFCKRHRGIVKDKYKNFENRSITKILGEWWASLDTNDKKCYVNLAKQNKDAFFSANPNFKWYKLPAPSLRTLNTRPGNIERPFAGSGEYQCDLNDSQIQSTLSYHTITHSNSYNRSEPKKVAYFKLADETQMGELNNLMRPVASASGDALQDALGETTDFFKTGCKRMSSSSFEDAPNTKRLHSDNSIDSSEDDLIPKKSARSCKGKKYQELMNSGQIAAVTPKKQVSPKPSTKTIASSSSSSQQFVVHNGHCSKVTSTIKDELFSPKKVSQPKAVEGQYLLPDSPDSYGSPTKQQFSFVSFDLEDKIRALPAQCLETYLQRKKNTKRKKKINSKKRTPQSKTEAVTSKGISQSQLHQPKTAQEAKEQMVGSQKRKARKESITRRDIHSIQNDVQVLLSSGCVNSVVVGNGVSAVPQTLIAVNRNATSDLLILAEVAANHTGIAQ